MSTIREDIARVQGSVDAEINALKEKMPWYRVALMCTAIGLAVACVTIACTTLAATTGPVAPALLIGCISAIIATAVSITSFVISILGEGEEVDRLAQKRTTLESLLAQLEQEAALEGH